MKLSDMTEKQIKELVENKPDDYMYILSQHPNQIERIFTFTWRVFSSLFNKGRIDLKKSFTTKKEAEEVLK